MQHPTEVLFCFALFCGPVEAVEVCNSTSVILP